jgi:bile acid:Na+ symporter, BASS family
MLGIGMTLREEDLKRVFLRPKDVLTGSCAQYGIMPVTGFILTRTLGL